MTLFTVTSCRGDSEEANNQQLQEEASVEMPKSKPSVAPKKEQEAIILPEVSLEFSSDSISENLTEAVVKKGTVLQQPQKSEEKEEESITQEPKTEEVPPIITVPNPIEPAEEYEMPEIDPF